MIYPDIVAFAGVLPPNRAVCGLDLGEKTIGVAVSDPTRTIASPLKTLPKGKFTDDTNRLFGLISERGVVAMVIGLPVNMDGTEGARCQSSRAFARNLLRLEASLIIAFWDERMSSMAVNRVLIDEFDATRAKRAARVDQMAAGWILQGALDRLRSVAR